MKAAVLKSPKTLELRDIPEPAVPEDGIVVEIKACGICGPEKMEGRPAARQRRCNPGP